MKEIETWVTMMFYPPENTPEYIRSLPLEVQRIIGRRNYIGGIAIDNFRYMMEMTFELEQDRQRRIERLWAELRQELVRYYERN